MASAQCEKPNTTVEVSQHKPNTAIQVYQPKTQHSSFGQKLSEITSKAFKGRHGSNQNQLECYESQGHNNTTKTENHFYGPQHEKKRGVSKTQITVTMVQTQITHTEEEDPYPYGTTTTCFGAPAKKNGDLNNNNKKDINLFRKIKNGLSRHNNNEGGNSSSSDSESDNDKCPKTKKGGSCKQNATKTKPV